MRKLGSLVAWWPRPTRAADPFISVVPRTVNSKIRVLPEYQALFGYLDHQHARTVVLSFFEMESLLGRPLPPIARHDDGWWTAAATRSSRQADAWMEAGRTARPNFAARTVAFERRLVSPNR